MQTLNSKETAAFVAELPTFFAKNEGREMLVKAIKDAGATSAILTDAELADFGIATGKKYTLKGSKSGSIALARRLEDGRLFVQVR